MSMLLKRRKDLRCLKVFKPEIGVIQKGVSGVHKYSSFEQVLNSFGEKSTLYAR